jgi:hypothetical protein
MVYDRHGYEKTEYVGEENSKEDIWTSGRTRNIEIRTNQELWNLYEDFFLVANITEKRLEWIGHQVRMGRPKLRWLEDAAKNL